MNLYNVNAKRNLKEGDLVRTPKRGIGTVVGFDLFEDESILVQGKNSSNFGKYNPNRLEVVYEGNELEPLPPITDVLTEGGFEERYWTCGGGICLQLSETHEILTLIPKDESNLREAFDSDGSFQEKVKGLLEVAFVTRLPHLVEDGFSRQIDSLIGSSLEEAVESLEKHGE